MVFTVHYHVNEKDLYKAVDFVNSGKSDAQVASLVEAFFPAEQTVDFDKMQEAEKVFSLNGLVANVIINKSNNEDWEERNKPHILLP